MKPFRIGLTGGIGSGKTTVASLFERLGAIVVDTDQIAHQLCAANGAAIAAIRAQFGDAMILPTGALDRNKMRERVFQDGSEKKRLEAILHPLISTEAEAQAQQNYGLRSNSEQAGYIIFVVPLLVESATWRQKVARILLIDCPEQTQIERVMQRNGLSEAQVTAIMQNQATRSERQKAADDILMNQGDLAGIETAVQALHEKYLNLASSNQQITDK